MTLQDGETLKGFASLLIFLPETVAATIGSPSKITPEPVPESLGTPIRRMWCRNDKHIFGRIVWPLQHAMGAYMFGNYLETTA